MGEKIANTLKGGEVFALVGELGSGKTTFVQGLAKGLGINRRIISPTFIIVRKYNIPLVHQPKGIKYFYNIDLYRFETEIEKEIKKEVANLGIEEIWSHLENVVAIEWAEKIRNIIPKRAVWIKFEDLGGDRRRIRVLEK